MTQITTPQRDKNDSNKPPITYTADLKISLINIIKLRLQQVANSDSDEIEDIKIKKFIKEAKTVYNFIDRYISHIHFNKRPDKQGIGFNNDLQVVLSFKLENIPQENFTEIKNTAFEYLQTEVIYLIFEELGKITNVALPNEVNKKGKFKRSGHLTDQMLKYNYPKDKQPSLFDILQTETLKDLEVAGVERAEIVEGIKLSPSETKIIDSLCKLLHEKSQTLDAKKNNYYTGNLPFEITEYGLESTQAPKLAFTLYELTQEYKGEDTISGKDLENVRTVLTKLDNRKFLIKYTETTKGKAGAWIKKEYEAYRKLIFVDKATLSYGVGDIESYKKTETIVLLNPIFRRQIDSKFILYPNDIQKRTAIAYGNDKVSSIALNLRDYLIREHGSKRYTPEIGLDRLYYILAEQWMKESRKKKVKEFTDKAIETVKALGLLIDYEIKPGATGEQKIVFTLNKEWD